MRRRLTQLFGWRAAAEALIWLRLDRRCPVFRTRNPVPWGVRLFRSIIDLQAAINRYLNEHNRDPKPFVWTRPARDILAKLTRLPVPSV